MEYKSARKILSENLKKLMDDNNITQKELSEQIGVSQSTISNWLQELKYPRIQHIQTVADFFNVPKSRITSNQEIKNTTNTFSEIVAAHIDDDATDEDKEEILAYIKMKMELRRKRK